MQCKAAVDLNTTLAAAPSLQASGFTYAQYTTSVDPTQKTVYLGNDFFSGSSLCLEKDATTGKFGMISHWSTLAGSSSATDQKMKDLVAQMETVDTANQVTMRHGTVYNTSKLIYANDTFNETMAARFPNLYAYDAERSPS